MGLYSIPCRRCGNLFMWFSGNTFNQNCPDCQEPAAPACRAESDKGMGSAAAPSPPTDEITNGTSPARLRADADEPCDSTVGNEYADKT